MKLSWKLLTILFAFFLFIANNGYALDYGVNITISDQNSDGGTGWHGDQEDQEVEPGMVGSQEWDLEGFFLGGNILSVVGGFDFFNGVANHPNYTTGDIFIDIDGDAQYGNIHSGYNGQVTVADTFGYDYVIDLDMATGVYSVYELNGSSTATVYYSENYGSNPWIYEGGGELVAGVLPFSYIQDLSDADTGFLGGTHYAITGFDLSFLGGDTAFTIHNTMGCGNDNLMGASTTAPVPEPASMLLLGTGLMGLASMGRKKLLKK